MQRVDYIVRLRCESKIVTGKQRQTEFCVTIIKKMKENRQNETFGAMMNFYKKYNCVLLPYCCCATASLMFK